MKKKQAEKLLPNEDQPLDSFCEALGGHTDLAEFVGYIWFSVLEDLERNLNGGNRTGFAMQGQLSPRP